MCRSSSLTVSSIVPLSNPLSFLILILAIAMTSCAAPDQKAMDLPLKAPTGTPPGAAAAVDAGNSLFEAGQWEQAKGQYETALTAHSTLGGSAL